MFVNISISGWLVTRKFICIVFQIIIQFVWPAAHRDSVCVLNLILVGLWGADIEIYCIRRYLLSNLSSRDVIFLCGKCSFVFSLTTSVQEYQPVRELVCCSSSEQYQGQLTCYRVGTFVVYQGQGAISLHTPLPSPLHIVFTNLIPAYTLQTRFWYRENCLSEVFGPPFQHLLLSRHLFKEWLGNTQWPIHLMHVVHSFPQCFISAEGILHFSQHSNQFYFVPGKLQFSHPRSPSIAEIAGLGEIIHTKKLCEHLGQMYIPNAVL